MTPTPPVTVSGQQPDAAQQSPARTGRAVLLLVVAAAGVAVASSTDPPPRPEVGLVVAPDDVAVARTGHAVVPLRLSVQGPALDVEDVEITADPVVEPSTSNGATRVRADGTAGIVAIVKPDCALLRTEPFRGEVLVRLVTDDGTEVEARADLGPASGPVRGACP